MDFVGRFVRRLRGVQGQWAALAVLVALAGIVAAVLWAAAVGRGDADRSRTAFRLESEQIAASVKLDIRRQEDLLQYEAAILLANPHISQAGWLGWARQARLFSRFPDC